MHENLVTPKCIVSSFTRFLLCNTWPLRVGRGWGVCVGGGGVCVWGGCVCAWGGCVCDTNDMCCLAAIKLGVLL